MRQRCENPRNPRYKDYGGRGIKVCDQWQSFENFLADMGMQPPGRTLERNDNDRGYEPGNCRWATRTDQASNTRINNRLTYNGKTMTIAEWARHLGVRDQLIRVRLSRGWSTADALSTDTINTGKRKRQIT